MNAPTPCLPSPSSNRCYFRPGEVINVYAYMQNTDSVEGRGSEYPGKFFLHRKDAVIMGSDKGVMGTPADVKAFKAVADEQGLLHVVWSGYGGSDPTVYESASAVRTADTKAKLKKSGLSDAELALLGYVRVSPKGE